MIDVVAQRHRFDDGVGAVVEQVERDLVVVGDPGRLVALAVVPLIETGSSSS